MIFKDKLKVICVAYVATTIISSVMALLKGIQTDTHFHLIVRLGVIIIAIAPLSIFDKLKNKKEIIRVACHYIVTLLLVFAFAWSTQIIEPLSPNAYRDVFFNYTGAYIVFCLMYLLYDKVGKPVIAKLKSNKAVN